MLGVDTNVLVRFLVRDDEAQFEKAHKLIKREVAAGRRVFVNQLVLLNRMGFAQPLRPAEELDHRNHFGLA